MMPEWDHLCADYSTDGDGGTVPACILCGAPTPAPCAAEGLILRGAARRSMIDIINLAPVAGVLVSDPRPAGYVI